MSRTSLLIVELVTDEPSKQMIKDYVEAAVQSFGGQLHPSHPMFYVRDVRVKSVKHIGKPDPRTLRELQDIADNDDTYDGGPLNRG